jgi:hypothetical protein
VNQTGLPQAGTAMGQATAPAGAGSPQGSPSSSEGGVPDDGQTGSASSGSSTPSDGGTPSPLGAAADEMDSPRHTVRHQWGYSGRRATVGFEHDVTIQVQADRIFVGRRPPIPCDHYLSSRELSAAVIGMLDRDARTWGPPPENFYWVPHINFVISPGGNIPFERIRPAIARHGLISSVDYRLDAPDPLQKMGLTSE